MQTRPGMRVVTETRTAWILASSLQLVPCGCGGATAETDERSARTQSSLDGSDCESASAGTGWLNHALPDASGLFTASWRSYPSTRPLDGVLGFSEGPAGSFADLGPAVRFAPSGYIDARDGSGYAGFAFPYTFGDGPYEFQLRVDVPAHRYSAWVRHLDAVYKPFELLGKDLAFRTEQSAVSRLNNWGAFIDSASGGIQSCHFENDPTNGCVQSTNDGAWRSRPFDARLATSTAHADLFAWVDSSNMDAVIGVAKGAPTAFVQLAASVRFRPDGRMDARNGDAYASDAVLVYQPNTYYVVSMDFDLTRGTYSVTVRDAVNAGTTQLAHDYAFRTEQAGSSDVDHVAQFVDGTPGSLNTCAMRAL